MLNKKLPVAKINSDKIKYFCKIVKCYYCEHFNAYSLIYLSLIDLERVRKVCRSLTSTGQNHINLSNDNEMAVI